MKNIKKKILVFLFIVGFAALEFPGIIIVGEMIEPRILGIPFLYAYMIFGWIYFALLFLLAYIIKWGNQKRD